MVSAGKASGHPDEVVADTQDVQEVPSRLVAEAQARHEFADSEFATPQERKQAAIERAHALSTRPDGSYAQLHETVEPRVAVADEDAARQLREQAEAARESLQGAAPAGSEAERAQSEQQAKDGGGTVTPPASGGEEQRPASASDVESRPAGGSGARAGGKASSKP